MSKRADADSGKKMEVSRPVSSYDAYALPLTSTMGVRRYGLNDEFGFECLHILSHDAFLFICRAYCVFQ